MSKAAELAALIGSQTALSNRNLIINGAMQVAQRGTSHTATGGGGYFTVDRWRYTQYNSYGADVDPVMSQSTDTPNNTFKNSFKFAVTTGTSITGADSINIDQHIEGQDIVQLGFGSSDAKSITLSFWVKASVAGTYCVTFNSGNSYGASRTMIKEYSISTANTWEYKTITTAGDTSGTWVDTNATGLGFCFTLSNGSSKQGSADTWLSNTGQQYLSTSNQTQLTETSGATWFITGVQLEVGEQATPFEHRSFADELARCERYYQYANNVIWSGDVTTGNNYYFISLRPSEMRTEPSVTLTSKADSGFDQSTMAAPGPNDHNTKYQLGVLCTSNVTQARGYFAFNAASDAEL